MRPARSEEVRCRIVSSTFFSVLEGTVQYRNMSRAFEIARTLQSIAPSCVWLKLGQTRFVCRVLLQLTVESRAQIRRHTEHN
jgi:hypothetical protein